MYYYTEIDAEISLVPLLCDSPLTPGQLILVWPHTLSAWQDNQFDASGMTVPGLVGAQGHKITESLTYCTRVVDTLKSLLYYTSLKQVVDPHLNCLLDICACRFYLSGFSVDLYVWRWDHTRR